MSSDYFKVKIENPKRRGRLPTYAVLGEAVPVYQIEYKERAWNIDDTLHMIRESTVKPSCLFMLIADQQTPSPTMVGDDVDRLFGRRLTGAERITYSNNAIWTGDYAITRDEDTSTAGRIYKDYNHFTSYGTQEADAILIDVQNPNNNWLYWEKRKNQVANELSEHVVKRILRVYDDMGVERPKLLFAGFGRGALLAYHLAGRMANESSKVVLVSIDPRVNEGYKDEKKLISGWYRKKGGRWIWQNKRPWCYKRDDYFPVLKSLRPEVTCYNVFQRHNFNSKAMNRTMAWPVGCAIEGAASPADFDVDGFSPCTGPAPFLQWDVTIGEHATMMLDRYAPWIIDVAIREDFMPRPIVDTITPNKGLAGIQAVLRGRCLDGGTVTIKTNDGEEGFEVTDVKVTDDGKTLTFKYPAEPPPGLKKISVKNSLGQSDDVIFRSAPCIDEVFTMTQIVDKEVTVKGYFEGDWTLHIDGVGISEELAMDLNGDEITFDVPHSGFYSSPAVGPVKFRAESKDGVLGDSIDFVIAPYIKSIDPASAMPGEDVTLQAFLGEGGFTNRLRFPSGSDVSLEAYVPSQDEVTIHTKVPDNASGVSGEITIACTDAGYNDIYSNFVAFSVLSVINGFLPEVPETGDIVEIKGAGFVSDDTLLLDDLNVNATVVDQYTLRFTLLAGIGKKTMMVRSVDGRQSAGVILGVAPFIDAASSPSSALPSEEVHMHGYFKRANSSPSGGNQLYYRGLPISAWLADENTLVFTVPEVAAGDGELQVTSAAGNTGNIINFSVKAKIVKLSKQSARPGDVLVIGGVNFTDTCRLHINGKNVAANYVDSDTYHWTVPDNAEPGPRCAVMLDTTTGLEGNEMEFGVTPYIKSLSTESEAPGATIVAHGFFSPDDHIQVEGKEAATEVNDERTLSFTMPLLRRGGSGEVVVVEGERQSNGAHCEVNFVAWPVMETRSAEDGEYHWLSAMDSECYHRADCWHVEKMAKEDLLGFASREDAWLFGFEPCNCVKAGGDQVPEMTLPASYVANANHLKHSFDFPYYGNVRSRELHREPCVRQVADIPIASRIGFLDPDEAHSLGFDNCHYCLGDSKC